MEVGDGLVVVERREAAELVVLDAHVVERVGDLVGCRQAQEGETLVGIGVISLSKSRCINLFKKYMYQFLSFTVKVIVFALMDKSCVSFLSSSNLR